MRSCSILVHDSQDVDLLFRTCLCIVPSYDICALVFLTLMAEEMLMIQRYIQSPRLQGESANFEAHLMCARFPYQKKWISTCVGCLYSAISLLIPRSNCISVGLSMCECFLKDVLYAKDQLKFFALCYFWLYCCWVCGYQLLDQKNFTNSEIQQSVQLASLRAG